MLSSFTAPLLPKVAVRPETKPLAPFWEKDKKKHPKLIYSLILIFHLKIWITLYIKEISNNIIIMSSFCKGCRKTKDNEGFGMKKDGSQYKTCETCRANKCKPHPNDKYMLVGGRTYLKGESPLEGVWHSDHTPFEVKEYVIFEKGVHRGISI